MKREAIESVLEDMDFIARSANRVVVLDALTDGPIERIDLEEQTGVSRATLGRVLGDFENRNWIRRDGREYRTTPVGDFVAEKLLLFLEQLATARTLAPVMRWLPPDGFGFDIRHLRDAEIVYGTAADPLAPVRQVDSWLRSAERVRLVSYEITASGLDAVWKQTVGGDQQIAAVLTPGVYTTIRDEPEMQTQFRELLETEDAEFYVYPEDQPLLVGVANGTAGIGLADDGLPRAVLFSDDDVVYDWAVETFETCRERAEPVTSATFTA